jgi:hypothetical protein
MKALTGCELFRARLQGIEQRLRTAASESETAGLFHMSALIATCANQVRSLLDANELPPTFRVESVIAHSEQALDAWASLSAF